MNRIMVDPITSRGTSSLEIRKWVTQYIGEKVKPARMFDLGCGLGVYGAVIKTMYRDLKVKIIGLDGFLPYLLQEPARHYYDTLIKGRIEDVVNGELWVDADLTICMDVIEHFDKPAAMKLLALPGHMIVSTPLFEYKQGPVAGNDLEAHKCWFTEGELCRAGYSTLCKFDHQSADGQAGPIAAFEKEA